MYTRDDDLHRALFGKPLVVCNYFYHEEVRKSAKKGNDMQHECRITVFETKYFPDLQEQYLADPKSGHCPFFKPGNTFLLKRIAGQDE